VGFYGTTSLRLELPIIGSFGLKFFPSGFENSLTPSNLRLSNVRLELFSDRNENHSAAISSGAMTLTPRVHDKTLLRSRRRDICDSRKTVAAMHNAS
jgi:hypothetical protein